MIKFHSWSCCNLLLVRAQGGLSALKPLWKTTVCVCDPAGRMSTSLGWVTPVTSIKQQLPAKTSAASATDLSGLPLQRFLHDSASFLSLPVPLLHEPLPECRASLTYMCLLESHYLKYEAAETSNYTQVLTCCSTLRVPVKTTGAKRKSCMNRTPHHPVDITSYITILLFFHLWKEVTLNDKGPPFCLNNII